jgi:hypothetical protein
MAIEIIPKKQQEFSSFKEKAYYIAISFFVLIVSLTFLFVFLKWKFSRDIINVQDTIESQKTSEILSLEERLQRYYVKMRNIPVVIGNRKSSLLYLENIEKITHPLVYFPSIKFDINNGLITGSGVAKNMVVFDQQSNIFSKSENVFNFDVSDFVIREDRTVEFPLAITIR